MEFQELLENIKKRNQSERKCLYTDINIENGRKAFIRIAETMLESKGQKYIPTREVDMILDWYYLLGTNPKTDYQKGILLKGTTGKGKTFLMDVFTEFTKIHTGIGRYKNGEFVKTILRKVNSRTIAEDFAIDGWEGIKKYYSWNCLFIDDIGAETMGSYYGSKVNTVAEVIDRREEQGLLTFGTTNLQRMSDGGYDDRTVSRMASLFNVWYISGDQDFRMNPSK